MPLTPADLNALRKLIEDHNTAMIIRLYGAEAAGVAQEDVDRLVTAGILKAEDLPQIDVIQDARLLGALRAQVEATGKTLAPLTYRELMLVKAPLTALEWVAVQEARNLAGQHMVALGRRLADEVAGNFMASDANLKAEQLGKIREAAAHGMEERRSIKQIASDMRTATEDWARDWHRVAATEVHNAAEAAHASHLRDAFGPDCLVYAMEAPDACETCKRLTYKDGGTGEPMVWRLSELAANGTNVGKKQRDWLPVVGTEHPNCRRYLALALKGWRFEKQGESWVHLPPVRETPAPEPTEAPE